MGIGNTNPQSKLHVSGGVRLDTLAGTGTRLVYANAQGQLVTPTPPNTNSTPSAPIPDNGCTSATGVTSTITVSGQPTSLASSAIRVRVDISHNYDEDLIVFLVSPGGNILRLIAGNGNNGDNFLNTVFWDGAAAILPTIGAPFTGQYKPIGNSGITTTCGMIPDVTTFGAMGGGTINPNGVWTLRLFDQAFADQGQLNNWGITFDGTDPVPVSSSVFPANALPKSNGLTLSASSIYEVQGHLGVGTSSPQLGLDVASDSIGLRNGAAWDHLYFRHDGGTAFINAGGAENGLAVRVGTGASGSYGQQTYTEGMRIKATGDVEVANNLTAAGVKLATVGGTASVLNHYEETSFTVIFGNGPNVYLSNQTIKAVRVGAQVTLTLPTDLLTMNVTGVLDIVMGTMPTRFRPASNLYIPVRLQNAGTAELGTAWVRTDGTVWMRRASQSNYGGANSGIFATSITYSVQ